MSKHSKAEVEDAKTQLRGILKPGDTIYCYVSHVSRSGMSRVIVPLVIQHDLNPAIRVRHIGWLVCKALEWGSDGDQGVKVQGCGMDMGFHLVETLGAVLFGRDACGIGQLRKEWI
jgi:hypothetical protein